MLGEWLDIVYILHILMDVFDGILSQYPQTLFKSIIVEVGLFDTMREEVSRLVHLIVLL